MNDEESVDGSVVSSASSRQSQRPRPPAPKKRGARASSRNSASLEPIATATQPAQQVAKSGAAPSTVPSAVPAATDKPQRARTTQPGATGGRSSINSVPAANLSNSASSSGQNSANLKAVPPTPPARSTPNEVCECYPGCVKDSCLPCGRNQPCVRCVYKPTEMCGCPACSFVHCSIKTRCFDSTKMPTTCYQLWHGLPPAPNKFSPLNNGDKWNSRAPPTQAGGWNNKWKEYSPTEGLRQGTGAPRKLSGLREFSSSLVLGRGPGHGHPPIPSWHNPSNVDGTKTRTYACVGCGDFNPPRVKRRVFREKDDEETNAALSVLSPRDRAAAEFRLQVSANAKRVTMDGKQTLGEVLAAANPLRSPVWWALKHPFTRLGFAVFVLWVNLFVYLGDPASYSGAKSYGTLVGDIYHGFLQPDDPGWFTLRMCLMLIMGGLGVQLGVYIQTRILRDRLQLVLFGFDQGLDPTRDPLIDTDGCFFVVILSTACSWYAGLKVYAGILAYCGTDPKHIPDGGMDGVDYAGYNFALGGLMAFASDWYNIVMTWDSMLQSIDHEDGTGYCAYAAPVPNLAPLDAILREKIRLVADWWEPRRVLISRLLLLIGWCCGLIPMWVNYNAIERVLHPEWEYGEDPTLWPSRASVGWQWAWSREWNTEHMRMFAGALAAACNLCIVAQDWDFPDFSDGESVKIVGTDFSSIKLYLPATLVHFCSKCTPRCTGLIGIYISAKWFSFAGIMLGASFDWAYWFMTALAFRPCDYAQLWDSTTGLIYSISDVALQEKYAGHQSAKNCSWFTDNPVLTFWSNRTDPATDPLLIRIDTGIFTGAYTIDEDENYVFNGDGPAGMWWFCALPMVGWCAVAYLIVSHDHVTWFNYDAVLAWFNEHGHSPEHFYDFDPEIDDAALAQEKRTQKALSEKSAAAAVAAAAAAASTVDNDSSSSDDERKDYDSSDSSDSDLDLEMSKGAKKTTKIGPGASPKKQSKSSVEANSKAATLAAEAAAAAMQASMRAGAAKDTTWCPCSRRKNKAKRLVGAARAAARDIRRQEFVSRNSSLRALTRRAPPPPPLPPLQRHAVPPPTLAAAAAWVHDTDYAGGEAPVLRANLNAAQLTWEQLVAEASASGDTVLEFNEVVCVRLFDVIDIDKNGTLSVEEVQQSAQSPAVAAFLKAAQEPALNALELANRHGADATSLSRADRLRIQRWKRALLDATQSDGTVSRSDWAVVIALLRDERLRFLKQFMLIRRKCYFGRGLTALRESTADLHASEARQAQKMQRAAESGASGSGDTSICQSIVVWISNLCTSNNSSNSSTSRSSSSGGNNTGNESTPFAGCLDPLGLVTYWHVLPRGWLEDLGYYLANHHPLLALWLYDPESPFSEWERRVDFALSFSVTAFFAALYVAVVAPAFEHNHHFLLHFIFVVWPVMATRLIAYGALGCPCLLVDAAKSRRISEESNNISNGGKSANIVPHSSASSTNSGHRSNNYKPPPKTAWEAWQLQMRQNARTFCQSHFMCAEALAVDLLAGVAFVLMLAALAIWVKLPPGGYSVCDDGSDDDVHCGEGDNADDVSINGDDTPQRQNPGIGTVLAFFPLTWGYWIMHTALWEFHPWCLGAPPPPSGQQQLKKKRNSSKNKHAKASDNSSNSCCAASASSSGSPSDVCSQTWQCFASVARKLWGPFGFGQWQRERAKILGVVRSRIRERGEANFATPGGGHYDPTHGDPVTRSSRVEALQSAVAAEVTRGTVPRKLHIYLKSRTFKAEVAAQLGRRGRHVLPPPPKLAALVHGMSRRVFYESANEQPPTQQDPHRVHCFTTEGWVEACVQAEGLRDHTSNSSSNSVKSASSVSSSNSVDRTNTSKDLTTAPGSDKASSQGDAKDEGHLNAVVELIKLLISAEAASLMRRLSDEKPLASDPWGPRGLHPPLASRISINNDNSKNCSQGHKDSKQEAVEDLGATLWVFAFMHRWDGSSSESSSDDGGENEIGHGKNHKDGGAIKRSNSLRPSTAKKLDERARVLQLHKDRLAGKLDENYDVEEAWNGHEEEAEEQDVKQDLWNSGMLDSDSFSDDSVSDSELEDPELAIVMKGLSANAPVLASSQPSLAVANQEADEEDSISASFCSENSFDSSTGKNSTASSGSVQSELPPPPPQVETPGSGQGSLPCPSSSLASSPAPGAAASPEEDFLQVVAGPPGSSSKQHPPLVLEVLNASHNVEGAVVLSLQSGGNHQRWTLESDGQVCPRHQHAQLALNASGGRAKAGVPLIVWHRAPAYKAESTQRWALSPKGHLASLGDPGLVVGLAARESLKPGAMLSLVHADKPEALKWQWVTHTGGVPRV